jgi:hypothetical protein
MPLQKLQFRPGVNRESTTLANEGGWFESEKVRWRSGYPEKIGGWEADTGQQATTVGNDPFVPAPIPAYTEPLPSGYSWSPASFWGVCRSMWNWLNLSGYNLLGLGTNLKYYIQNGVDGAFFDVTPVRATTAPGGATFAATTGSSTITVTDLAHNAQTGDFVVFSDAAGLGGAVTATVLNAEYQITFVNADTYTITVPVTATSADIGNGGAATVAQYQIAVGADIYTIGVGWGAGGWGGITAGAPDTGWGEAAPAGLGIGIQLRLWSEANFGQDLVMNPRGGALYLWHVNPDPNAFDRAVLLSPTSSGVYQTDVDCPSICNGVTVSDSSRFVIAFGCNDYGSTVLDPMLIRWSNQEDYATWTPDITNQAGSYRLSHGSTIIASLQTRQEILVWTDASVYSMQYLGAPYVWGFQLLGDNTSIISPNAAVTINNVTYWMGVDKFYMYSGRVETLPCSVRQYVFQDINASQGFQAFGGTNEGYNEIWWFYCSANSTVVDKYVVYNHLERTWYYGTMNRSAWLDSPLRPEPMAAGYGGQLLYHETGVDDGSTVPLSPIYAYCQSSDFDIGDGHNLGLAWRIIPDVTFDGSTSADPSLNFTVRPRQNPGSNYGATDNPAVTSANNYANQRTYNVQQFTEIVYIRIRGRQMAFRVESTDLGVAWQLGSPRLDVRPDGRR